MDILDAAEWRMDAGSFSEKLLKGERLLWTGRPASGLRLTSRDAVLVPCSLAWLAFAVFWEASVMRISGAPVFFMIWGAFFVAVGIFLFVGRFALDAWVRRGTRYAVTDRRILIARPKPFAEFTSVNLDRLPEIRLRESAAGCGTIQFGEEAPLLQTGLQGMALWSPALQSMPQFLAINDARSVYSLIHDASATSGAR